MALQKVKERYKIFNKLIKERLIIDNQERIERIKLNELRIAELIRQRNETLKKIMELYRKEKESQNEQTD